MNKHTSVVFQNGSEKIFEESVRLFRPDELRAALSVCGVSIEVEYGGVWGRSFLD